MEFKIKLNSIALIVVVIVAFLISEHLSNACELEQAHHGCRIENGACQCSYGCKSQYPYVSRKDCSEALKGRANDICGRKPCLNGGTCIQTAVHPGYRCRCEGTNYWGTRCQRSCPVGEEVHRVVPFPYECVVI